MASGLMLVSEFTRGVLVYAYRLGLRVASGFLSGRVQGKRLPHSHGDIIRSDSGDASVARTVCFSVARGRRYRCLTPLKRAWK